MCAYMYKLCLCRGIIPRAIEQIFGHISRHAGPCMRFLVRASYLQASTSQRAYPSLVNPFTS